MLKNIKKSRKGQNDRYRVGANHANMKAMTKLVIDPRQTLLALKKALKVTKDIVRRGGTVLLVGSNPKYKPVLKSYYLDVKQPYMGHSWVNGVLSNGQFLNDFIPRYGFKMDRAPLSEWLRYNKVSDFLTKFEGYVGCLERPSLVIFLNTSDLGDAVNEVNSLNIPSIGLATTSLDISKLTYAVPSNDQSLKTISLFVNLIKLAIKDGQKQRQLVLDHMAASQKIDN